MIIGVLNLKGGSGKTSISVNLAASLAQNGENNICILDGDKGQESSLNWVKRRPEEYPKITGQLADIANITEQTNELLQDNKYIIIDGAPKIEDNGDILSFVSDLVIVPLKPSVIDYESTEKFILSLRQTRAFQARKNMKPTEVRIVITEALTNEVVYKQVKEAIEMLEEGLFFTILKATDYRHAYNEGIGITEYDTGTAKKIFQEFTDKLLQSI